MLRKLLKYEFKATARLFFPLYIALFVFALFNRFISPFKVLESTVYFNFHAILSLLSVIAYFILIVGIIAMTVVIMILRFYKSLLGDEGYLMFTLPVQPWKHIVSKLVVATVWIVLSLLVTLASVLIIAEVPELLRHLSEGISGFREFLGLSGFFTLPGFSLLALVSTILMIYAAIALGHLFTKHKLIASFAMYIALDFVSQVVMIIILLPFVIAFWPNLVNMTEPTAQHINLFILVISLPTIILTIGYYILTNMILKKKLNLE